MPACARPVGYVPRQTHECDAANDCVLPDVLVVKPRHIEL